MKVMGENAETKTSEMNTCQLYQLASALLCGCILLALAFLLGRVCKALSPDMLVKERCVLSSAFSKFPPPAA